MIYDANSDSLLICLRKHKSEVGHRMVVRWPFAFIFAVLSFMMNESTGRNVNIRSMAPEY